MHLFQCLLDARFRALFFVVFALAVAALVCVCSPQQVPVIVYKVSLVTLAACVGLFLDAAMFPYADPSSYLDTDWKNDPDADNLFEADYPIAKGYHVPFVVACLRRVLLVCVCALAVCLGL